VLYDGTNMSQLWIGAAIIGAATLAGFVLKRLLYAGSASRNRIDVGVVSQSWLTEQRAGKRDDRFSS
jgi:hypothetical protein